MTFETWKANFVARINALFPTPLAAQIPEYGLPDNDVMFRAFTAAEAKGIDTQEVSDAFVDRLRLFGQGDGLEDGTYARRAIRSELNVCLYDNVAWHFERGTPLLNGEDIRPIPLPGGEPTLSNSEIMIRARAVEPYRCDGATAFGDRMVVDVTLKNGSTGRRRSDGKPTPAEVSATAPFVSPAFMDSAAERLGRFEKARANAAYEALNDDVLFVGVAIHDMDPGTLLNADIHTPAQACAEWAKNDQRFVNLKISG